jgi:hypothetical protein
MRVDKIFVAGVAMGRSERRGYGLRYDIFGDRIWVEFQVKNNMKGFNIVGTEGFMWYGCFAVGVSRGLDVIDEITKGREDALDSYDTELRRTSAETAGETDDSERGVYRMRVEDIMRE